jgi:hypothetical protein
LAVEAGGERQQSRAKRASAPFPASAERALLPHPWVSLKASSAACPARRARQQFSAFLLSDSSSASGSGVQSKSGNGSTSWFNSSR